MFHTYSDPLVISIMILLFLCIVPMISELSTPQFSNSIYPELGYTGSRVLETNYTAHPFVDVEWTQLSSDKYMVMPGQHVVVFEGRVFAGESGRAGFNDGTSASALFNSPSGIAHFTDATTEVLFVVDSGNFVIRRISQGRVVTLAGTAGQSGLRDGDGRKALFTNPTSVGIDPLTGTTLFVLDAGIVRMVTIGKDEVTVQSLIDGACRAIAGRTVRCQLDWPSTTVDTWVWPTYCLGHATLCESRYDLN